MHVTTAPRLALVLPFAAVVLAALPALAETSTDTLSVQVSVQESCSISGTTIDFGTYSSGQQAALDAQGDISFDGCPQGTLAISLDGGATGNVTSRRMSSNGGDDLDYQLYRNSSRSQIWGAGDDAVRQVLMVPGSGTLAVYGRIPGEQEVPAGGYSDVVNITMEF